MSTRRFRLAVVAVLWAGLGSSAWAGGVGVLGDSYSDEYQFYRPDRSTARNWVEILAAARGVDFGEFRTSSWGEPRNAGFAYNWARSGATSASMIASGQHTGLAEQVARGEVSTVVIFIGGNDFIDALHSADPRSALSGLNRKAFANVRLAADTILAASPDVKLLVATVPDIRDLPEFRDPLRAGTLDTQAATLAAGEVEAFNAQVRAMAAPGNRVAIFDFAKLTRISVVLQPQYMTVGGRKVERERPGNSPDRLFLGDVRHLGTMGQGMLAKLMTDALNRKCGAGLKPLDEREIVAFADRLGGGANVAGSAIPAAMTTGLP